MDEARLVYCVIINRIFPVRSLATITWDRAFYLYVVLTWTLIDFGSFVFLIMKDLRIADLGMFLPFKVQVTWIVEHVDVSLDDQPTTQPEGPFTSRFFNASGSYLHGAATIARAPRAQRSTMRGRSSDGASSSRSTHLLRVVIAMTFPTRPAYINSRRGGGVPVRGI